MMFTFYISKGYYRESGTLLGTSVSGGVATQELPSPWSWVPLTRGCIY